MDVFITCQAKSQEYEAMLSKSPEDPTTLEVSNKVFFDMIVCENNLTCYFVLSYSWYSYTYIIYIHYVLISGLYISFLILNLNLILQ